MVEFRESKISAHHNYLVNNLLTPGFVLGNPNSRDGFYFLADVVIPEQGTPRISGRLMNEQGDFLLELNQNRIGENPLGCAHHPLPGGFRILHPSDEPLLEVVTQIFPRGHLTRIKARLFDEQCDLRMEPLGDSIQVHGEAKLVLDTPFSFTTRK